MKELEEKKKINHIMVYGQGDERIRGAIGKSKQDTK